MRKLALLVAALALPGCAAIEPARMQLPVALQGDTEQIAITGMSGWERGHYAAGPWSGEYYRRLERTRLMGLFQRTRSDAAFVIEGPGISDTIEADCGVRERTLTLGGVAFKPAPMAYRCDFTALGRPIPARFELQENRRGLDNVLTRNARRGEIGLAGEIVSFRSVHAVEGSGMPVEDPIGYVFEQDGRAIGALELNGRPVLRYPRGTDLDRQRAMVVASVALATIWDPEQVGD